MKEIWKDVVGYEGLYQVSDLGNVKRNGNVLRPQRRNHGYLSVWLYDGNGKRKQMSIHRLVATAFIKNPHEYPEVNHIDECKENNRATNLEWCTHKSNSSHGTRGDRIARANKNGKKSRKIAQYTMSGELVMVYPSLHESERNGFMASNICRCANGAKNYSNAYGFIWRYVS